MLARFSSRRTLLFVLAVLLVVLQYPLWFGNGGVYALWKLKREIAAQRDENVELRERNQALAADVVDLKQGLAAIEERARIELGMIKQGETFYQIVEHDPPGAAEQ